jgi:hypothetical protein
MVGSLLRAILLNYVDSYCEHCQNSIARSQSTGHVNPDINSLRHDNA